MEAKAGKIRITELDAFRGLCLIGVFISHFYFDLTLFYSLPEAPGFFGTVFEYGGILFVVLSGICTNLGRTPLRRGHAVFGCAMLITAVSYAAAVVLGDRSIVIRFGILHLLGICMLLTPYLRKLPDSLLLFFAAVIVVTGYLITNVHVSVGWLFPLGLKTVSFSSGDYWPLLPQLGFFMFGIVAGRKLYPEKKPVFPALQGKLPFLSAVGRRSLLLYLLQQPVTFGLIFLFDFLFLHKISI